jgi:predicted ATPase with chaperone activity
VLFKTVFLFDEKFSPATCNARVKIKELQSIWRIDEAGKDFIKKAMDKIGLSASVYDRILKVARKVPLINVNAKALER